MCDGHFVGNTDFQLTVPAWFEIIPCWTTQVEYNVPLIRGSRVKLIKVNYSAWYVALLLGRHAATEQRQSRYETPFFNESSHDD